MAREGKRFLRAFSSSPICSPARHSLLTGVSAGNQYVRGNGYGPESADVDIETDRTTMAKILSKQGYATYAVGKWGVATSETSSGSPCKQGFDKFFGKFTHKSLGQAFPQTIESCTASAADTPVSTTYSENADASEAQCFETNACTYFDFAIRDQALTFIDEAATNTAPFFLYWATTSGHSTNWEYVTNRLGKKNCELKTHPVPSYGRYTESNLEGTGRVTPEIRGLMSMIENTVDEDMRLLLAKLKEHELGNSTLVVFTSDHGAHQEAYADADYNPHTDFYGTGGLRGIKRRLHEGGVRVPLLMWWPDAIPAGTTTSYPVALYDLPLTFAAVAGVDPDDASLDALNVAGGGMSLEALLRSEDDDASGLDASSRDYVYTEMCFVEDGKERSEDQVCPVTWNTYAGCGFGLYDLSQWPKKVLKLVQDRPREGSLELYDILADPFEENDLAEDSPDEVERLLAMVAEARTPSCLAESSIHTGSFKFPDNGSNVISDAFPNSGAHSASHALPNIAPTLERKSTFAPTMSTPSPTESEAIDDYSDAASEDQAGAGSAPSSASSFSPTGPNIVLYLADDVGSGSVLQHAPEWSFSDDTSALEAIPEARRIQTPTLERMAREGKRFLRAFSSSPICSPARHSLLTGVSAGNQYVRGNGYGPESADVDIETDRTTMAKILSKQGYATYAVGKWGVATSETSSGSPCKQGFDKFFGKFTHKSLGQAFPRTIESCTASAANSPVSTTYSENSDASESKCSETDACTYFDFAIRDTALSFIDEAAADATPFFLYWATTSGHATSWEYVEDRLSSGTCETKTNPVPSYGRYTESNLEGTGRVSAAIRGLMSMMEYTIDEDMRLLLAKLKEHEMENSTLVIFTSDNGAHKAAYADPDYDPRTDFYGTGGLRGIKRRLYEGGVRVPFLAWWPEAIPAGTTSMYPIALYDLPLTFAAVAGIAPDDASLDALKVAGGGMSLEALLRSENDTASGLNASSRDYVYTEMCFVEDGKEKDDDQVCPVMWNTYAGCGFGLYDLSQWPEKVLKLVQNKPREGSLELFDIVSDPFEETDLATSEMEAYERLQSMLWNVRTPSCTAEASYEPRALSMRMVWRHVRGVHAGANLVSDGGAIDIANTISLNVANRIANAISFAIANTAHALPNGRTDGIT
ncbi:Arylsulfatase [Hondaea fermentalgiana]|uniref:Arylsulfatase n=1 Tax=Hondaea fermentalgiana TaxID=2315210 RepID=A0A2R5G3J2_9STRA|nr:Arylsulfatase [Hondaea fermentalgiana]|eukprot:GBG25606.1 Arylsulfatase [Hondaea fermentalgiana]